MAALAVVEGPFAMAYWDERGKTLWFGRDRLGRRSLLVKRPSAASGWGGWAVASCIGDGDALRTVRDGGGEGWEEVPPGGLWRVEADGMQVEVCEWPERAGGALLRPREMYDVPGEGEGGVPRTAVEELRKRLEKAVALRVAGCGPPIEAAEGGGTGARVCVLFSGGVDSTLLAVMAHGHVPEAEPIDLVNVCFDPCEAPDR